MFCLVSQVANGEAAVSICKLIIITDVSTDCVTTRSILQHCFSNTSDGVNGEAAISICKLIIITDVSTDCVITRSNPSAMF